MRYSPGDQFSPFMFLICAEGFLGLIRTKVHNHDLCGIAMGRQTLVVSHILFADSSLFFMEASDQAITALFNTFRQYKDLSRQEGNLRKSKVMFGRGVDLDNQQHLCSSMHIRLEDANNGKYLGFLYVIGCSKKQVFSYL